MRAKASPFGFCFFNTRAFAKSTGWRNPRSLSATQRNATQRGAARRETRRDDRVHSVTDLIAGWRGGLLELLELPATSVLGRKGVGKKGCSCSFRESLLKLVLFFYSLIDVTSTRHQILSRMSRKEKIDEKEKTGERSGREKRETRERARETKEEREEERERRRGGEEERRRRVSRLLVFVSLFFQNFFFLTERRRRGLVQQGKVK